MKNPLVSIAIPVYNGSNYLEEAIDSALSQTYKMVEVIVVNDGSTDQGRTKDIALSYGDSLKYYEKNNGGVASALNFAIGKMHGTFFSWLSHDDKYYPWKIEKQLDFYLSLKITDSVIFSHEDIIDSNGHIVQRGIAYDFDPEKLVFTLLYQRFIGGCSLLIPKHAFDVTGLFSIKYKTVQDYDMWFRMLNNGFKFAYLPIVSGMSRVHDQQDSRKLAFLHKKERNCFFIEIQSWLREELWLNIWANKAYAFFYLALQYKVSKLSKAYWYSYKQGVRELLLCGFNLRTCCYALFVLTWNRLYRWLPVFRIN